MDVGRPEENARKAALRHTAEVALRRFGLDLLRIVIVAEMRSQRMRQDIRLVRRGESARLALIEAL